MADELLHDVYCKPLDDNAKKLIPLYKQNDQQLIKDYYRKNITDDKNLLDLIFF